ncbi:MAG: UTP--glucose-1-phosphate uridylyltransferase [Candidatus Staskawiczbacteria bacterium]|nr:UTP--glucose-1-phosphate uridylyltransferase [Candidatus Staskawiczbacteria bacterium]
MEKQKEIKKAIIPVAGLGTRFLPLSKVLSKEFFPLADKPVIQYIVQEIKDSGIEEIVFVISANQKAIVNYFQKAPELEKILKKRKKDAILKELQTFHDAFKDIKMTFVVQKEPGGDGHAILQAAKYVKNEPVANSFGDDVIFAETPATLQLINIFKTCNAPVIGLKRLPKDKIPAYGMVQVEKISSNLYKIKKIIEKPEPSQIVSDLVILGRHILTPEVFEYLKKAKPGKKGEIILAEVLSKMLDEGKPIYGYELSGEWLECGDKLKWMKSFFYMALKDSKYRDELKQYIKTIK